MINFDPALLGPYFSKKISNVTLPVGASQQILQGNPQRVLLGISGTTNGLTVKPSASMIGSTDGLLYPANFAAIIYSFADWGSIVGGEWSVWNTAPGITIFVLEVLYLPPAGA